ncbi:WXG100 family type VII secretion target [Streptomyces sp. IBSBF 2435]|uniref:WXG100 family type VII secretion target n=1 Tax=Streptomyces sp. IBSBF 2435 TaxID=2903531 RepID=UPI002FDC1A8E
MTSRLKVELAALAELVGELSGQAHDLEDLLTQLDAGMKRFEASWQGEARNRFGSVFAQWRQASTDLNKALSDMHHVTNTAHGNYHSAETANLRIWSGGR